MRSRQLPSEGPVGPRCFSGLLGLSLMNGLNLNTAPLINGVWSDNLHLGPGSVGFLLTAQLLAAAIASIALSNRVHQIAPRRWGIAAGAALVAANLWLAYAGAYCAPFGGIVVMGLGLGCLTACGAAAIARTLRVDRNAAIVLLGMTMLVAVLTVPVAHLAEASGRSGLFLSQAAVALAAVGLTALLPEPQSPKRGAASDAAAPGDALAARTLRRLSGDWHSRCLGVYRTHRRRHRARCDAGRRHYRGHVPVRHRGRAQRDSCCAAGP